GHGSPTREQFDLFRALPGDMAPRDSQDLMAYPFFSLSKSRRTAPIDFHTGGVTVRVEGTAEHGIATIWDADLLIWAASTTTSVPMVRSHSSRSRASTATVIAAGRRSGSRVACCMRVWLSAPTRRRPSGRRS